MRLPDAASVPLGRRAAVRVSPDALRHIRAGHPWVFDRSIRSVSHTPSTGDLVVVFDERRRFAAIGLWDDSSPIRIKVLHQGEPEPVDYDFFAERLRRALRVRESLVEDPRTDGFRVCHGENDGLPGLVVDQYARSLVVKIYSPAWWPHLRDVLEPLHELLAPERVVLRMSRLVSRELAAGSPPALVVSGPEPAGPVEFVENGLRFTADVMAGQKTGHFLDQRDNRARVRDLAADARVLDVFCHTGGFATHAAAGGAHSVVAVDSSGPALSAVAGHLEMNRAHAGVARCRMDAVRSDAFAALAELGSRRARFDLVVIDPPSFASRAAEVDGALRAYRKLAELGVAVVADGGHLVQASCSSRVDADSFVATVGAAVRSSGREHELQAVTGHPVDHPVRHSEGAYLKAAFFRL